MIERTREGRVLLNDPAAKDLLALLAKHSHDPRIVTDVARAALDLGWHELFLSLVAGEWVGYEYADWHRQILNWAESIRPGIKPRPLVVCAPRGAGKSTALSLALLVMIARRSRSYGLWVSNTARQTEDAIAGMGELLAAPLFAQAFPDAAAQYRTEQGRARDWTKNRLRTASGFTLDGIGLDQSMRGARTGSIRPDLILFDDLEESTDSPATTAKKRAQMTDAIIPAGSADVAVVFVQNRIHESGTDGLMVELTEGRADMLADALVIGPIPMIDGLEYAEQTPTEKDARRYVVTAGLPTWAGQSIETAEAMINETGLSAFLRERQHADAPADGGLFDPSHWIRGRVEITELVKVCRSWDLAFTADAGDFTVGVLLGTDRQGRTYVLDVIRVRVDAADVLDLIADTRRDDDRRAGARVPIVVEEMPAAGKALKATIERELAGSILHFVRPQSSKVERAAAWASEVQRGRATIAVPDESKAAAEALVREHASFPNGRHDDTVDACTQGHSWLTANRKRRGRISNGAARASTSR